MIATYKGCKIEVTRDKSLGGWSALFYNIFDGNYEVTSGFSETTDTVREFIRDLKSVVDDYRENPDDYMNI